MPHTEADLSKLLIPEIRIIAEKLNINDYKKLNKKELINLILQLDTKKPHTENRTAHTEKPHTENRIMQPDILAQGVLEIQNDGHGFLRSADYNYLSSPDDVYVSNSQIKLFGLKTGDTVAGALRLPKEGERNYALLKVNFINGYTTEQAKHRTHFDNLIPLHPHKKLDIVFKKSQQLALTQVVDFITPIGKGQRGLIVAQPKTGKTTLLKEIANAIAANHPECYLIVLLIDERPEEVTDMQRSVKGEVVASTFDAMPENHVRLANIVLQKAKRLVESGQDVVILLDSLTRLARAHNTVAPASGKVLSGGIEANALQRPKAFLEQRGR